MKFRFTAEMFEAQSPLGEYLEDHAASLAADIANALLDAEEKKCERVYGKLHKGPLEFSWQPSEGDTHTALLWQVEEIGK